MSQFDPPEPADAPNLPLVDMPTPNGGRVQVPAHFMSPQLSSPASYAPTNYSADSLIALNDPKVLCNACVHGHVVESAAATHNRRDDGTAFVEFSGRCLIAPAAPMDLELMRPLRCSRYERRVVVGLQFGADVPANAPIDLGQIGLDDLPGFRTPEQE